MRGRAGRPGCAQEGQGFVNGPGTYLAGFPGGQFRQARDVAADEFLAGGTGESGAKDLPHQLHVPDRLAFSELAVKESLDIRN
jgi:hypothetical protein